MAIKIIVQIAKNETKFNLKVKTMTNYERIKQMTVPEMARLIGSIHSDFDKHIRTINGDNIFDSFDDIEEWLESEVKDND